MPCIRADTTSRWEELMPNASGLKLNNWQATKTQKGHSPSTVEPITTSLEVQWVRLLINYNERLTYFSSVLESSRR